VVQTNWSIIKALNAKIFFMKNKELFNQVMVVIFAVIAFIFTVSYAFSQYLEMRKINVQDLAVWNACVENSNLGDRAYQFCKEKSSENYLFKEHFDWSSQLGDDLTR